MLTARVLSAFVLIPLVAFTAWQGGPWFAGLVAVFVALAVTEFYQITRRLGARPSVHVGIVLSVFIVLAALSPNYRLAPSAFILAVGALMVIRVLQQNFDNLLSDWSATIVGSAYIGGMLSHFVLLRGLRGEGLAWVAVAAITTWIADTAAYFVGSTVGRRPFFPRVSPRKTWEGAIAGLIGGTLTGATIAILFLHLSWPLAAALGLLVSLAATFGDLAESLVKRQAGIKDSGNLIPGHGGALDRIDSLLFAGVATYYFAVWIVGAGS